MKTLIVYIAIIILVISYLSGCIFGTDDNSPKKPPPTNDFVSVQLLTDRIPGYLETATITLKYVINYPLDRTDTLDYNSHGWFRVGPPAFSIEAGESCWAETVSSFHEVEHSIVIRALRKGQYIIDAFVAAPLDTDSVLGNNASIVLNID